MTGSYDFDNNGTFTTDKLKIKIIYDQKQEPAYIYRFDEDKFELRSFLKQGELVNETSIKEIQELNNPPMKDNAHILYIHDFYVDNHLYFLIAVKPTDYFETFFYLLDHTTNHLSRLHLNRPIKGSITNIYVSPAFKSYHVITIGTLDSAIYVFRITSSLEQFKKQLEKSHVFNFTLIRTDARNGITQHVFELEHEFKSPSNIYLVSAGSNGILDFFLLKSTMDINLEPDLQFIRHGIENLPSNLPIISLQSFNLSSTHLLFVIGQELKGTYKRKCGPSISIIKLKKQTLVGEAIASNKYLPGSYILPLIQQDERYIARSISFDKETIIVNDSPFDARDLKFVQEDKTNRYFDCPDETNDNIQHLMIKTNECCVLTQTGISTCSLKKAGSKRKLEA